jgi:pimeloyl-ACP methyl ester carboxylesterase
LSIPDFADDVVALAGHLGMGQVVLGGISMGAAVALSIATRFPRLVDGLVLLRPAWRDRPEPTNLAVFPILAQYLRRWGGDGVAGFVREPEYLRIAALSSDNAASLRRQFEASRPIERAVVLELIFHSPLGYAREALRLVSAPTLIVGNGEDAMHPIEIARDLARWIPQAQCREVVSKSVDPVRHGTEVRRLTLDFLAVSGAASGRSR